MTMQPAEVIPPDVELWATGYLRTFLAGRTESYAANVRVSNKKVGGGRQIVVRRDGGPVVGVFDTPRIAVRVWADSERDAADLARLVVGALKVAPGDGPVVATLGVFGPSPIPDAAQPQYLVNAELRLRCSPL